MLLLLVRIIVIIIIIVILAIIKAQVYLCTAYKKYVYTSFGPQSSDFAQEFGVGQQSVCVPQVPQVDLVHLLSPLTSPDLPSGCLT